jgi:DNA-3-methyladenine glycosylase II
VTVIRKQEDIEAGLEALVRLDPRLLAVAKGAGPVPLRLSEPGFASLASIVVSQMVSRASAQAIWRRIAEAGGVTASDYAALLPEQVAGFGLSRAKAATLQALARAVSEQHIDLEAICFVEADEALRQLTALPGIGPWTAEVYLMFCAGHPDIFPVGDGALRAAVGQALGFTERPAAKELFMLAEAWRPWRSVAARLFWAYYARSVRRETLPVL